jgi:hypothetical protein
VADLWLPEEDRLCLWEPLGRQLRVIGWRPGPAGVSSVELAPGVVVAVDHATPTILTELVVPVDGGALTPGHRRLLSTLVGEDAALTLESIIDSDRPDRPVTIRISDRSRDRSPRRWDRSRFDGDRAPGGDAEARIRAFARLALAAGLADDATLPGSARAVAILEAAAATGALTADAPVLVDLEDVVPADRLAAALRDVTAAVRQRPDLAAAFRNLVDRLPATTRAVLALDLERLRRHIDEAEAGNRFGRAAGAAAPAAAATPASMERLLAPMAAEEAPPRRAAKAAAEPRRPPLDVDGDHRAWAWLDHGGNVAVTAGASAAGAWARVFRRHDRLLLGLAPLRADLATTAGQVQAIVLVPPVADAHDLVADVVDDPATPRRAPAHDQIRAAVTAGRRAARLTRLGHPMAEAAWMECADHWRALGDEQRANLAVRHGQQAFDTGKLASARRRPQPDRLLADELTP